MSLTDAEFGFNGEVVDPFRGSQFIHAPLVKGTVQDYGDSNDSLLFSHVFWETPTRGEGEMMRWGNERCHRFFGGVLALTLLMVSTTAFAEAGKLDVRTKTFAPFAFDEVG